MLLWTDKKDDRLKNEKMDGRQGLQLTASDFGGTGGGVDTLVTTVPREPSSEEDEWKDMRFGSFPKPSAF